MSAIQTNSESREPSPQATKKASPPFQKATANVILRASDNVDFYARKAILEEASPIFETMFSLPQIPENRKRKERDEDEYVDGIPVVVLSEDSQTLDDILRYCYPIQPPTLNTAVRVCNALAAARKYAMDSIEDALVERFAIVASREPIRSYIYATQRTWVAEMKVAARACLQVPLSFECDDPLVDTISAGAYIRLHKYHRKCREAIMKVLTPVHDGSQYGGQFLSWDWPWFIFKPNSQLPRWLARMCKHSPHVITHKVRWVDDGQETLSSVQPWFVLFVKTLQHECYSRPCGSTIRDADTSSHVVSGMNHCSDCSYHIKGDVDYAKNTIATYIDTIVNGIVLEYKD